MRVGVVALVAALAVGLPTSANAEQYKGGYGGGGYGGGYGGSGGYKYSNYSGHNYSYNHYNYYRPYGGYYYSHYHNNWLGPAIFGLIGGVIIGTAIAASYPPVYAPPPPVVYAPPPQVVYAPQPRPLDCIEVVVGRDPGGYPVTRRYCRQ